jgi:hypothetical protein
MLHNHSTSLVLHTGFVAYKITMDRIRQKVCDCFQFAQAHGFGRHDSLYTMTMAALHDDVRMENARYAALAAAPARENTRFPATSAALIRHFECTEELDASREQPVAADEQPVAADDRECARMHWNRP